MKTVHITTIAAIAATLTLAPKSLHSQGMPAENRETIHGLFDAHDKFQRVVKQTEDGYVSTTTSDDPNAVTLIQKHVKQMESRLKKGLMVRRWDPAYEEFVNHYDDIDIRIKNIDNGISITAVGTTDEAREVARNHAGIISKFVKNGWKEHDVAHPAVVANAQPAEVAGKERACCLADSKGESQKACCSANTGKPIAKEAATEACAECTKKSAQNSGAEANKPLAKAVDASKPCCKETAIKIANECPDGAKEGATNE